MRTTSVGLLLGAVALAAACSRTATGPSLSPDSPAVLALSPANAATGVDPAKPVVVTFSRSMMMGMESLVVLHEGSVTGPAVSGVSSWSSDRTVLTFMPASPLKAHTSYVLHFAPSLKSAAGQSINLAACSSLGGQYASGTMMGIAAGGGMMNGAWGSGMMGDGWRSADGTYGMVFGFTTA